jgi:hypothetical protein
MIYDYDLYQYMYTVWWKVDPEQKSIQLSAKIEICWLQEKLAFFGNSRPE